MAKTNALMLVLILGACQGELVVGDPDLQVAELTLQADQSGALQAAECIREQGVENCALYPNPVGCDSIAIRVMGDGSTQGICQILEQAQQMATQLTQRVRQQLEQAQEPIEKVLTSAGQGLPIACRVRDDGGCVQCIDIYGTATVDSCNRDTQLFVGQANVGPGQSPPANSDGSGTTPEDDVTPPGDEGTPGGGGGGQCEPQKAAQAFVDALNESLKKEGLKFSYGPSTAAPKGGGFFGDNDFFSSPESFCDDLWKEPLAGMCDPRAVMQGRCYCDENDMFGTRCRCARITSNARRIACEAIPADCDKGALAAKIWSEEGAASAWLNGGSGIPLPGFFAGGAGGGDKSIDDAQAPKDITCQGSPLVLDLADDGIALTSVRQGVTFDLTGRGTVRTAWVEGADDALLAIDLDGSGSIDHGGELFGEGSRLGGSPADNGLQALGALDQPSFGGNANGLVEAGDLMFEQLVLWRDRNRDGRSQPDELQPVAVSIAALELTPQIVAGSADAHGNDLSLRARFIRADGRSGTMIDVYFVTASR